MCLVAFPCELFNSTLEENYEDVKQHWRSIRRSVRSAAGVIDTLERGWMGASVVILVAAALYALLDPRFGLPVSSLALYAGSVLGLVIVTVGFDLPGAMYVRFHLREHVHVRALPATLVIAAGCVGISALVHLQPGYLYGVVAGYAWGAEVRARDAGRAVALSAAGMFLVSLAAWLSRGLLADASTGPAILADSMLAMVFLTGLEITTFGLLPLRFLDGARVWEWSRTGWALLIGAGLFGFIHVLVNQKSGYLQSGPLATLVVPFVAFGVVSMVFWAYFRIRHAHARRAAAR
jgi:hypothetical protein